MSLFQGLLDKYIAGSITEEELQELLDLLPENQHTLEEKILEDLKAHVFDGMTSGPQRERIFNRIIQQKTGTRNAPKIISFSWKWIAAASVILRLAAGGYLLWIKQPIPMTFIARKQAGKDDISPGGSHATLTLSNGATIVLDQAKIGSLAKQGNTTVVKHDSDKLVYYFKGANNAPIEYNTISTPRGGEYEV